ncbi:MAG: preprotein translocase subunit YajC [Candidatus Sumerlaeia bacterium]|nr:preprotein translocase subunit YajC [Candidatus Sumerlaeia bacterium]
MMDGWPLLFLAGAAEPPKAPTMEFLWLFAIIGIMFWLMIIRPQRREQQEKQRMLSMVEKGDRVITIGGIHGTVAGVDDKNKTVTIDVGKGVKIEFSRSAIASIEKKKKSGEEASREGQSGS